MKFSTAALTLLTLAVSNGETQKISGSRRNVAGAGFMQTYMIVDDAEQMLELGVELDKDLMELDLMPSTPSDGKNDIINRKTGEVAWYCCGHEEEIEYPQGGRIDHPFDHFVANWNPTGHGGPGYAIPHWDFHFYTMTKQERESVKAPKLDDICTDFGDVFIPMTCSDFYYQNQAIPCDEVPPVHFLPGPPGLGLAVEPHMGSHM